MRTLIRAGALSAVAAAALFAAPNAYATAPGDNGTVKIHDATTGEELRRNEPHVCTFYLDAFGFDGVQEVDWHIEAWAPTADVKGETVKSGEITLDAEGHGRTEDLSLPDGHYKLFWNFEGEKGAAKHKVFWTDCEGSDDDGKPSETPSSSASSSPSASPSESAPAGGSSEPSASSSPSAQGGGGSDSEGGDLAETGNGAPVGLLSGAAAALVAAGGYLVFRRRKA
ncbi:LPXTG cell wall anchor domain-containing protein [Streptomyces justiciae]|uniref:LPXTG cell wall anchor domain-containing protein n=1 Tax=Streptomyces justiciae TaxID=2780140 RepID=UPI001882E293|nr:LPXTG cell wall anchor domain-containing protein [Streptomyces justiciae]MBE8473967.1 LPXTG cell wall anchor domain-containing protein [Streptomyces justiciae]MCW8375320.1 LPXTG cell wall anchor domain-containing protein [Streptomyces justiciae]